jgi:hypothetical protein
MECPPSARLEEPYPDSTSEYAKEGTAAHTYAELKLGRIIGTVKNKEVKNFEKNNEYYSKSMTDYIETYTDLVMEKHAEAQTRSKDAILMLEQRLDFSRWVPEGFGTGDTVIISDGILEVIDLKYGKGVPVEAQNNPQLRLYGLGAWNIFRYLYDIKKVRTTICQPRLDNISTEELEVKELLEWAKTQVEPKAKLAWDGNGEFKAGKHCRFCRARSTCRARAEANTELAKYDFKPAPELTKEEIADILAKIDELANWAKDVKDHALEQAEKHGVKWPGWKLVEGRSRRTYTDEDKIAETLKKKRYRIKDIYKPKQLIGITAMQKLLGKKKMQELIGDYIVKPAGKPTLVPEDDKRPELSTADNAAEDFKK